MIINVIRKLFGSVYYPIVYRKKALKVERGVRIVNVSFNNHNYIYSNAKLRDVEIGDFSYIGKRSQVAFAKIGRFCSVGEDVKIGLGLHPTDLVSTHPSFYSNNKKSFCFSNELMVDEYKNAEIGNDVWIGTNAIVLGGVKVGDGAIIAAGAIVTKNVEPYSIVGGNPAKVIKYRFSEEVITKLIGLRIWERDLKWIEDNYTYFLNAELFIKTFS
jgi:acetyltransferase-like isoleucine patch superfamily enzyme